MMERYVADADPQNILESPINDIVLGSYFYLLYFYYLWLHTWYNIGETKAPRWIKRDVISNVVKLTADEDW